MTMIMISQELLNQLDTPCVRIIEPGRFPHPKGKIKEILVNFPYLAFPSFSTK